MDSMRIMRATGLSGIKSVLWQSATASVIGDGLAGLHCPFLSHGLDLRLVFLRYSIPNSIYVRRMMKEYAIPSM